MPKNTITSGEWYVKVETRKVYIYDQDPNRGDCIAVFENDEDGLALANHICDTHNAVPDMIDVLQSMVDDFESGYIANPSAACDRRRARFLAKIKAALRKAGQID